jgi:hypothetical protein
MDHLEDKDLRGRIILKLTYSNTVEVYGRHLLDSEREPTMWFCEGGNDSVVFTKCVEFLDYLNNSCEPESEVDEYIY